MNTYNVLHNNVTKDNINSINSNIHEHERKSQGANSIRAHLLSKPITSKPSLTRGKKKRKQARGQVRMTEISNKPIQTRSIRYVGDANSTTSVLVSSLLSMLVFGLSTSTTAYRLFESVRIRCVSITVLGETSASGVGYFSFSWDGPHSPHSEENGIFAVGEPFRKTYYPPEDSLAYLWQSDDVPDLTQSLFSVALSSTDGTSVMDISFEYVLVDGLATTVTLTSGAPANTGIYAVKLSATTDDYEAAGLNNVTI